MHSNRRRLFLGKRQRECDGCFDETLPVLILYVGLRGGADIAAHAASAHHDRTHARNGKCPALVVRAYTEHEASAPAAAKQVAMKQKSPSAKHGLFAHPGQIAQGAMYKFFKTRISWHRASMRTATVATTHGHMLPAMSKILYYFPKCAST
jgi:hypothetical protein